MELLISNISERTGVREDVLEKDYYVTLLLKELSEKNNQIMLTSKVVQHCIKH